MASIEQELHRFITKYEINPKYGAVLHRLVDFHTVIVADDSASMASLADPDDSNNPGVTRWQELKTTMKIILEAHHALGLTVDIFFVNRGRLQNVRTIEDVERMLRASPTGPSQILRALQEVQSLYMTEESLQDKNLILHILSDGRPTKADAEEDLPSFEHWLVHRPLAERVNISLILCTDDTEIEQVYRVLETAAAGTSFSQRLKQRRHRRSMSPSPGSPPVPPPASSPSTSLDTTNISSRIGRPYAPTDNVDVTLDYRGEILQVWRTHGRHFPFNYGDYVTKILVGSIDEKVHEADLARNRRLSEIAPEDLPPHPLLAANSHSEEEGKHESSCIIA